MSFPAEGDHQHHHRIPVAQEGELYSLKWHTFQSHLTSGLKQFLFDGDFLTDVTLVAEGKMIRSHRMLLSLCSPHFKQLFQGNSAQNVNTIVILNNVRYQDLQHVIQFIYNGEVKVSNNYELQGFLQTGELLQIEGLTKTSSKHETEGREPASQQQQGHLSPNAQSTPIPQMHHRRSHIQVPNKGGPGPARSHQIPVTSAGDGSSHPPPTKRTRLLPTATVTSATVAYGEANNVVSSITGDLNSSSLEDGGDGVSGIDPLAVPDLSSIAAMVEHDPLNLMNETGVSQHQHQHGVPGIDDEEQMITIDSIKSESGVEGLYDERDEEEDEEGFEMTDHGDASGLGVDGMYDVKSSGPGPSSAISGGASVGGGANVKPPGFKYSGQIGSGGLLQCPKCNKSYSSGGSLQRHIKAVHVGKRHYCPCCSAKFMHRFHMTYHLKSCVKKEAWAGQESSREFLTTTPVQQGEISDVTFAKKRTSSKAPFNDTLI
ncbi:broad-complex core protein isoforms 1/2/3/4/5 isoform X4 [Folsomia candida]|uniref:broad-complex core protein isoforms 1/2/3/4/5 isoform X4 n=1 Tax=Folsomia candida TaxID=158441 RepID=UPI000B901E37|nr:broad-complex core protein isoforms 1/2/3/4/5 isoform X4 [Folsomia candida]